MMKESINHVQVALLMEATGCNHHTAVRALAVRDGILDFAIEYLNRRDLDGAMDEKARFPTWTQYMSQRRMTDD
jgi:hypothetical protein